MFSFLDKDDIIPTIIHLHTFVHDTAVMHIAQDKIKYWIFSDWLTLLTMTYSKSHDWIVSWNDDVSNVAFKVVNL